jgi:hypothetical protein
VDAGTLTLTVGADDTIFMNGTRVVGTVPLAEGDQLKFVREGYRNGQNLYEVQPTEESTQENTQPLTPPTPPRSLSVVKEETPKLSAKEEAPKVPVSSVPNVVSRPPATALREVTLVPQTLPVFVGEESAGFVELLANTTLADVRAMVLEEFDDDQLPPGVKNGDVGFYFTFCNNRVSSFQEKRLMPLSKPDGRVCLVPKTQRLPPAPALPSSSSSSASSSSSTAASPPAPSPSSLSAPSSAVSAPSAQLLHLAKPPVAPAAETKAEAAAAPFSAPAPAPTPEANQKPGKNEKAEAEGPVVGDHKDDAVANELRDVDIYDSSDEMQPRAMDFNELSDMEESEDDADVEDKAEQARHAEVAQQAAAVDSAVSDTKTVLHNLSAALKPLAVADPVRAAEWGKDVKALEKRLMLPSTVVGVLGGTGVNKTNPSFPLYPLAII